MVLEWGTGPYVLTKSLQEGVEGVDSTDLGRGLTPHAGLLWPRPGFSLTQTQEHRGNDRLTTLRPLTARRARRTRPGPLPSNLLDWKAEPTAAGRSCHGQKETSQARCRASGGPGFSLNSFPSPVYQWTTSGHSSQVQDWMWAWLASGKQQIQGNEVPTR
ncbi:hypothetical protein U0070_020125 [Myodes glareolus]|uniref:Uncharacterized protein n=1 Tax=Myodes glareolus TaxID=447135 RepID=A0AAW0HMZ9_MYOGA